MSKELEALAELKDTCKTWLRPVIYTLQEDRFELIENTLKDYEWLKSVISIDMFDQLPTPEDKIRFLGIMGVEL